VLSAPQTATAITTQTGRKYRHVSSGEIVQGFAEQNPFNRQQVSSQDLLKSAFTLLDKAS
jgi:hypothetical protein